MARIYQEADCDPTIVRSEIVAVVGYGNQGRAQALNLRDSGAQVVVGLRAGSRTAELVGADDLRTAEIPEAVRTADMVVMCIPDPQMPEVFDQAVRPQLAPGTAVVFAHGFNIHFGRIAPPPSIDVMLVAPKGAGQLLRSRFVAGSGLMAMVGVHQDATGRALGRALSYAWAIGSARCGIIEGSFREETETDLFSEQAVLCGGIPAVLTAAYETLVAAGYSPEAAYIECIVEAKLITDMIFEFGIAGMLQRVSTTAAWGGLGAQDKIVTPTTREAMSELLSRIQDGSFADRLVQEIESGSPNLASSMKAIRNHPLERTGQLIRALGRVSNSG